MQITIWFSVVKHLFPWDFVCTFNCFVQKKLTQHVGFIFVCNHLFSSFCHVYCFDCLGVEPFFMNKNTSSMKITSTQRSYFNHFVSFNYTLIDIYYNYCLKGGFQMKISPANNFETHVWGKKYIKRFLMQLVW